jgi:aminopeptidase
MDERIRRHAEILVDYCTEVERGDMVEVRASPQAENLVIALYAELGKRGARPTLSWSNSKAGRAYAMEMDPDDVVTKEHSLAAMEETDVVIMVTGGGNRKESVDVPTDYREAAQRAHQPILQERLEKRWVITHYPTEAGAQQAEMSTAAYEDFVWSAINRDWEEQRAFQAEMVERLESADEARVVAGDETDVTLDISGMHAENDHGKMNMPAGEAFTVPRREGVDGTVRFDLPVVFQSHEIEGAYLEFEDGRVVDHDAHANAHMLESILDVDEGARYLGELGIGMNRGIDRFTYNMLFDEKMGDTVHLAVGDAIEECIPEDVERNESATHVDMLVDMSEDSRIELDGEVVQEDGTFVFEDREARTV